MPFNSIGDLASSLLNSQSTILAKRNLQRYSTELTTGLTSNVKDVLRNDMARQVQWERELASNQVLDNTLSEALTRTQAKQLALSSIDSAATTFANNITTALASNSKPVLDTLSKNGVTALNQALSQLNMQVAGTSLFAGASTDSAALASSDILLQSVKDYIAPSITPSAITQKVREWMDDQSGGFDDAAYLGSNIDTSSIRVAESRSIAETSRADHPAIKGVIENLLLAALASDDDLDLPDNSKAELLKEASNGLRSASTQIIGLEADIGYVEGELQNAKTRVSTEISTTEQIRADTIGIDEFEVASKLQSTELQLEKIYALTARASRMSLLEYLR